MANFLKHIFPYAVCAILLLLLLRECNVSKDGESIIKEVVVTVPETKGRFDTIDFEKPATKKQPPTVLTEIDSTYINRYFAAKDSIEALNLYIDAITEREYTQSFQDSVQTVSVFSQVRGELLRQSVDYEIYQREVATNDTLPIPPRRPSLYFSGEIGTGRVLKAGLQLQTRRQAYSLSVDSDKNIWAGVYVPLF